jgi:glycerol-3-phosphate acyltransferase PlsY
VALALIALGYLCGAIPSGVLLARVAGIDVRRAGSGNIGATNVVRTAGMRLGLLTLAADVTKGVVPVAIAQLVTVGDVLPAATAVAAFLGHLFPPTLGFAGGKGVATALGVSLMLYPVVTVPTIGAFLATLAATGWVSLGSMIAAILAPILLLVLGDPAPAHLVASIVMALLIVIRHRDNFARILAGTEPKVLLHKQATPGK